MTSMRVVRLTCKSWNTLSNSESFKKMHIGKVTSTREGESRVIMLIDYNLFLMSAVVMDVVDLSIEFKGKLCCLKEHVKISQVFHCEGLLLCILKDDTRIVVWNPYRQETRWIIPRYSHRPYVMNNIRYALGYENNKSGRSLKLLRFIDYCYTEKHICWHEIYDFDSDLWTTLDVTPHWYILSNWSCVQGVSLKGNTYWCAREENSDGYNHIICFDFTRERFGPLLPLPVNVIDNEYEYVTSSCVREGKIAALFQHNDSYPYELEIWITTKIEAEMVSWNKFLRIDIEPNNNIMVPFIYGGFFIDEEKKKVALGFDEEFGRKTFNIIGEDGYFREFDRITFNIIEEAGERAGVNCGSYVCSYVPSLVRIKKPAQGKRKRQSSLEKLRFDQNTWIFDSIYQATASQIRRRRPTR